MLNPAPLKQGKELGYKKYDFHKISSQIPVVSQYRYLQLKSNANSTDLAPTQTLMMMMMMMMMINFISVSSLLVGHIRPTNREHEIKNTISATN